MKANLKNLHKKLSHLVFCLISFLFPRRICWCNDSRVYILSYWALKRAGGNVSISPFLGGSGGQKRLKRAGDKVYISGKYQFAYYKVPKAASTTVLYALLDATKDGLKRPLNLSVKDLRKVNDEYFHFTFVRDPFDRFVSCYINKILRNELTTKISRFLNKEKTAKISVLDFVMYLEQGGLFKNQHWVPQACLLARPIGNFDFIGKVEIPYRSSK